MSVEGVQESLTDAVEAIAVRTGAVGAWVSGTGGGGRFGSTLKVKSFLVETWPAATCKVKLNLPAVVGVPEIIADD